MNHIKNTLFLGLMLLFLSSAAWAEKKDTPLSLEGTTKVTAEEVIDLIGNFDDLTIVDARKNSDREKGWIEGSIGLPNTDTTPESLAKVAGDKAKPIMFYCNGVKCGKSKKAVNEARKMGYTQLIVYAEGMPVWEEKGMPIYAGPEYEKRIETEKLSPQQLQALVESKADTFTVVDVRDPEEYRKGHIPGAINIPSSTFASQSEVLDKDKQIIVYCNGGGRSNKAYGKLMKLGYKKRYQSLFTDWKEAGQKIEKQG